MGREIRRVIPNWEHPKRENGSYQPLYDRSASESFAEWMEEFNTFKRDELKEVCDEHDYDINDPYSVFCEWHGSPPDHNYHRQYWSESSATWWQVYETVSEGTPVSPPFETQEELVSYLIENGDFWDQSRRREGRAAMIDCSPWSRRKAENFVFGSGWAPSGVISSGVFMSGVDALCDRE
ncbi:hypothetical protein [uncultured Paraglaciecola sp.]|uniref:hypothetical protein n=1 Tax=uncultured Paraglaciecola sp. TaxID=1765024 RepID=UPI00262D9390|nr:hypothetical protein [uncultured Paraglaciecola sp.]